MHFPECYFQEPLLDLKTSSERKAVSGRTSQMPATTLNLIQPNYAFDAHS